MGFWACGAEIRSQRAGLELQESEVYGVTFANAAAWHGMAGHGMAWTTVSYLMFDEDNQLQA